MIIIINKRRCRNVFNFISSRTRSNDKKITGNAETKKFLNSLGFVIGEGITIVSDLGGNLIVNIKGARIALDKGMASRILV